MTNVSFSPTICQQHAKIDVKIAADHRPTRGAALVVQKQDISQCCCSHPDHSAMYFLQAVHGSALHSSNRGWRRRVALECAEALQEPSDLFARKFAVRRASCLQILASFLSFLRMRQATLTYVCGPGQLGAAPCPSNPAHLAGMFYRSSP